MKLLLVLLLFSILIIIAPSNIWAKENNSKNIDGKITFNSILTESEEKAVGMIAEIIPTLNMERYFINKKGVGYLGPYFEIQKGSDDAFESLLAKASGFWMLTPPIDEDGEPDYIRHWINIFPFSAGIETDLEFKNPISLLEIGWTPIGPRKKIDLKSQSRFGLSLNRNMGLFLQGGYKFDNKNNSDSTIHEIEENYKTKEKPDMLTARVKAELVYGFSFMNFFEIVPKGTGWFDIVNQEFYYHMEAKFRIVIKPSKLSIDCLYQRGSGAPNFNKGDQYSGGLTIMF
ncbi:MAG TPA: hypothetical protein PLP19_18415 [bacterium]|nr:hypothetical protein [bacterium]HPN45472.1 hypothetical protein [bacterium]